MTTEPGAVQLRMRVVATCVEVFVAGRPQQNYSPVIGYRDLIIQAPGELSN